jgi:hypothetical protein
LAPLSLRLTSRTIWSIWNGCKRLGSFANVARHFAKTASGLFCDCWHSSIIFWMVASQSSKRIGYVSLIRYLGEERLRRSNDVGQEHFTERHYHPSSWPGSPGGISTA